MADATTPTVINNSGTGYKEILAAAPGITTEPSFILTRSFAFDGTNENFQCAAGFDSTWNSTLCGAAVKWTIGVWFKRSAIGSSHSIICRDNSSGANRQFIAFISSANKITINCWTNTTNFIQFLQTGTFTDTASYHLLTVTYDQTLVATSRISVKIDDVAVAGTTSQTGAFGQIQSITTPAIEIGGRTTSAINLNGNVHCVGLFNVVLSVSELTELYKTNKTFNWLTHSKAANLVSYLIAGNGTTFGSQWTWTDRVIAASATSSNMEFADLVISAPAS